MVVILLAITLFGFFAWKVEHLLTIISRNSLQ